MPRRPHSGGGWRRQPEPAAGSGAFCSGKHSTLSKSTLRKIASNYEARAMIADGGHYLGNVLRHSNPKRALEVYDHGLMRIREVPNDVHARRQEALLLAGSSYAARWLHREGDARERIDAAFRLLRETKDYPAKTIMPGSEADSAIRALADHYAETGQSHQAMDCYYELRRQDHGIESRPSERSAQRDSNLAARRFSGRAAPARGPDRRGCRFGGKPSETVAALGPQASE